MDSSDVSQVKSVSGAPVDGTNFRNDVTVNGDINASDVSLTKLKSGTGSAVSGFLSKQTQVGGRM